ncbi:MAG: hypothetical protein AAF721_24140 [Myxococcota bacterium]
MVRHLRCAWLEYQDIRDAIVFMHGATTRLGFENALASLPKGPGGPRTRQAANFPDLDIKVHKHKSGKATFRGFIAQPSPKDDLSRWVCSPAVEGANLVLHSGATHPIDLLVVSGHGMAGMVWGDGSGDDVYFELSSAFTDHVAAPRAGNLKCLIIPSCNNVHEMMAPGWFSAFNHPKPVYMVLGYRDSYAGGATGARVMAKFVQLLKADRSQPIVDAWRAANVPRKQPWAALVAKGAEGMNVEDWVNDKLPKLTNVKDLVYFDDDNAGGKPAKLKNDKFESRWVMDDGTVIDINNNGLGDPDKGLFSGKKGTIRIKALKSELHFEKDEFCFLGIYLYRSSKKFSITDLLEFDPALLKNHPDTGKPVVSFEKGLMRAEAGNVDALRIVIPKAGDTLELPFTVKADAAKKFKDDGPGGSHGRFLLDFGGPDDSFDEIDEDGDRSAGWFGEPAVTAGALLWK